MVAAGSVTALACGEDLSAEALIDRLTGAVKDFAGDASQGDDMTVVVLKVERRKDSFSHESEEGS